MIQAARRKLIQGGGPLTAREWILLGITAVSVILFLGSQTVLLTTGAASSSSSFRPLVTTLGQHNHYYEQHYPILYMAPPLPSTKAYRCAAKTVEQVKDNLQSQQGEDLELLSHFNGLCGGSYIEMGALDGKTFSNSWLFHREFYWKGVLIELDADNYQKLERNRHKELFTTRAAVCAANQTVHYVSGHEAVNGVWEHASAAFRQRWWPDIESPQDLETLTCIPLQQLLDNHLQHVVQQQQSHGLFFFDFFSLDVEGSEWAVLQTVDWDKTSFGIIVVEAPDNKGVERNAIVSYLQRQGYKYLGEKNNSLWFLNGNFHEIYKKVLL